LPILEERGGGEHALKKNHIKEIVGELPGQGRGREKHPETGGRKLKTSSLKGRIPLKLWGNSVKKGVLKGKKEERKKRVFVLPLGALWPKKKGKNGRLDASGDTGEGGRVNFLLEEETERLV